MNLPSSPGCECLGFVMMYREGRIAGWEAKKTQWNSVGLCCNNMMETSYAWVIWVDRKGNTLIVGIYEDEKLTKGRSWHIFVMWKYIWEAL